MPTSTVTRNGKSRSVLFVGHDASRTGAPAVLLHLLRWFKANSDLQFTIALDKGGALEDDFKAVAPTVILNKALPAKLAGAKRVGNIPVVGPCLKWLRNRLGASKAAANPTALVYGNTVASWHAIRSMGLANVPTVIHVHELQNAIDIAAGEAGMQYLLQRTGHFIACSQSVSDNLSRTYAIAAEKLSLHPECFPMTRSAADGVGAGWARARQEMNIPESALVVGGCGGLDSRKGADLFVAMATQVVAQLPDHDVRFVWIGRAGLDAAFDAKVRSAAASVPALHGRLTFAGERLDPQSWFCGFDVFALTSREDPMPLVALEAAAVGKPVVCFADAGGIPDVVRDDAGAVVPHSDTEAMARAAIKLLLDSDARTRAGAVGAARVADQHDVAVVGRRILSLIESHLGESISA